MKFWTLNIFILAGLSLLSMNCHAQNPVNWTEKQLEQPAALANTIRTNRDVPVIINIGPDATIPHSIDVGMVNNAEGLQKLKNSVKSIGKNKKIVIYCGCCPFDRCPNVRPAIEVLKKMKFTNYYLLNLPSNIKKDWIDKGYPVTNS